MMMETGGLRWRSGSSWNLDDRLARQARLRLQAPGAVEEILLQLVSLLQRVETPWMMQWQVVQAQTPPQASPRCGVDGQA